MDTITHLVLSGTNLFSILPISRLIQTQRHKGAALITATAFASFLMHMSERKHRLPGLFLARYSRLFLNIDRVLAWVSAFYGSYLFWENPYKNFIQLMFPLVTLVMGAIGENTKDLQLYCTSHSMFHFLAYYALYLVIF